MNATKTISCSALHDVPLDTVVIDVMTPEAYAACHIAGAANACIYEVVFLEKVQEAIADRDRRIVVYDASGSTQAAVLACRRLSEAGYRNVAVLEGGLAAWRSAGLPVETGTAASSEPQLQDGRYLIDTEKSVLEWIGRNLNNRHLGRIALTEGELVVRGGTMTDGRVVADMTSIGNSDLTDATWREILLKHLKSDDFLAVERHPTARFELTEWTQRPGAAAEVITGIAAGNLTVREVSAPVRFPATLSPQPDGSLKAHALLDIDRTLWRVNYGSAKLFEQLGMHLVDDIVTLELFIVAVNPES
jgi:rhodanese-related sulfurtransferase